MNDLLAKYNTLSPDLQREVDSFLDKLLAKSHEKNTFDLKTWKERIKKVTVWSDEDIKSIEEGSKYFSQWTPEQW